MKLGVVKIIFFGALFVTLSTHAQTYAEEEQTIQEEVIEVQESVNTPAIFTALGVNNSENQRNSEIVGNTVFLKQIGALNNATIVSATGRSEINVLQNGTSNSVGLFYRVNSAVADIEQQGNFNRIIDFVNNPSQDVSLDVTQEGNGLRFERFGTNSITKSLQFKQTEASPTLIIRSYN